MLDLVRHQPGAAGRRGAQAAGATRFAAASALLSVLPGTRVPCSCSCLSEGPILLDDKDKRYIAGYWQYKCIAHTLCVNRCCVAIGAVCFQRRSGLLSNATRRCRHVQYKLRLAGISAKPMIIGCCDRLVRLACHCDGAGWSGRFGRPRCIPRRPTRHRYQQFA